MKTKAIGMFAGAVLALAAGAAAAFQVSPELRQAIQADLEAIEKEGPKMGEVMAALREVGASYLPELVANADPDAVQSMARRRMMTGVYLMDLTYAATFDRQPEAARFGQALYALLDLVGYPEPDLERRYREALAQIDEPGGDERLRQLVTEQNKRPAWQDRLDTGMGVELVADSLYGFMIEGLYLTSELCILSNYDPATMMYVAYLRNSFKAYEKLLYRLGDSPEFATAVDQHERLGFLATILVILGDGPTVAPAQLDALRPAIAKARKEIVP